MTPQPAAPIKGKILVIDDNPIIQRAVYFQFRDQGYKVLMSGDITGALVLVRQETPDVILLDINFPNEYSTTSEPRDGFWATKWLQKMDEAKNIPWVPWRSSPNRSTRKNSWPPSKKQWPTKKPSRHRVPV